MITSDNLDIAGRSRPHERTRILRHRLVPSLLVFLIVGVATSGCSLTAPSSRLSLSEAVDVAREQISFEPATTDVTTGERRGRDVWIVTFLGSGLGLYAQVAVDRSNGDVVSVAIS